MLTFKFLINTSSFFKLELLSAILRKVIFGFFSIKNNTTFPIINCKTDISSRPPIPGGLNDRPDSFSRYES